MTEAPALQSPARPHFNVGVLEATEGLDHSLCYEHLFATVPFTHYEVAVTIPKALDDQTWRFLDAVQRSANRLVSFRGDAMAIKLIVEVSGMCREDAMRAAAVEVARIFPACNDEKYGEPHQK